MSRIKPHIAGAGLTKAKLFKRSSKTYNPHMPAKFMQFGTMPKNHI
jgi:hypothetical protein